MTPVASRPCSPVSNEAVSTQESTPPKKQPKGLFLCTKCGKPFRRNWLRYEICKMCRIGGVKPRVLTFFWEDCNGEIRWWRNDNAGDMFDIITKEELAARIKGAEMCKIPVVDHLPGFCSLGDECPDHLGYH